MTGASGQDLLGGRYRLLERRGSGGMAEVWWARDEILDRDVAVKVLAPQLLPERRSRDRIRAEAQAVARLYHPNIAAVHDYGESGDVPYVVMELLDGMTLAEHLANQQAKHQTEHQALPWRDAVTICAEVAAALAAAHARGVVHRDIKPANVMLTSTGCKVVDFGIAGIAGALEASDASGRVLGTPAYLAPERLLSETVVPASDVYALGLLLYRCLTGDLPWRATTPTQVLVNHCHEPPQPLPALPGLPGSVYAIYDTCLAKDPAARPDAATVARVLADVAGAHVSLPRDADASRVPVALRAPSAPADPNGVTVNAHRHASLVRGGLVALGVTAVVAATGFTATYLVKRDAEARAADQPMAAADASLGCHVRYEVRRQGDGVVGGTLTLTNTGGQAFRGWTLRFDFAGRERLVTGLGGVWRQDGTAVTLTSDAVLAAGQAATVAFTAHGSSNAMPLVFRLDETLCAAQSTDLTGAPVPSPVVTTPAGSVFVAPDPSATAVPVPSTDVAPAPTPSRPEPTSSTAPGNPTPSEGSPTRSRNGRKPTPSHTRKS